jgi:hypothetical protein
VVRIAKAPNDANDLGDFVPFNIDRVEQHLAGVLTNGSGVPLVNEAAGPYGNGFYLESGVIKYEQCGTTPTGDGDTFPTIANAPFPYVLPGSYSPCQNDAPGGPNLISLTALTYLDLQPGLYRLAVRSDDGFRLTTGTGANPTNTTVTEYLAGRSAQYPSETEFLITQAGLYPFKLAYFEGTFGASVQFYSINRSTGEPALINGSTTGALKAWLSPSLPLNIQVLNNEAVLTWTNAAFVLQAAPAVTGSYTNVPGATSPFTNVLTSQPKYFRLAKPLY